MPGVKLSIRVLGKEKLDNAIHKLVKNTDRQAKPLAESRVIKSGVRKGSGKHCLIQRFAGDAKQGREQRYYRIRED